MTAFIPVAGRWPTATAARRWRAQVLMAAAPLWLASAAVAPIHAQSAPLFTSRDAIMAGAFAVTTIAMFPLDRAFAQKLQDPRTQANRFFRRASTGFELIASPGAYFIGGSLYAAGRLGRSWQAARLGWHGTEAVLIADVVGSGLKFALGRARPYVSKAERPNDFKLGGGLGGSDRQSFPSGHSFTAFAAASAVTAETRIWWPKATWAVGPAMYGGATMVGLSRMYHNKHWASDVVLGAAIGTFAGRKVVEYARAHPDNAVDRGILPKSARRKVAPGPTFVFSIPW